MSLSGAEMRDFRAELSGLERRDWWRWLLALAVIIGLMLGMFSLSFSSLGPNSPEYYRLRIASKLLFALITVFAGCVIYQQAVINRLRRDLAAHIGMIATLDVLKPLTYTDEGRNKQRRVQRSDFNQLVIVKRTPDDKKPISGRARDISEYGLGAVIPESLQPGDTVVLEFGLVKNGPKLEIPAVVRHRHGFHHGFEFVGMDRAEVEELRKVTNCLVTD